MYDLISRKAAIDRIRAERDKSATPKEWRDGMNMAIFCLIYLSPIQSETCGDAVSRNAIVQKLNEMDRYVSTELRLCDTDKKFPQNEVFIVDDVYEEIEQLPPAQPEQQYIPVTEESVIQAGYEGREVRFRLRGRLFAIRELAQ